MAKPTHEAVHWLPAARAGDKEALGQMLDCYRGYLLLIAQQGLSPQLQAKVGASDLVQETWADAYQHFAHFHGDTEGEWRAWLRTLLLHNLAKSVRRFLKTQKRGGAGETPLAGGDSSGGAPEPSAAATSPSSAAIRQEVHEALERALERLPEDYQLVILLRYFEDLSFEDIGRVMDRSANAVQKLFARAIDRFQQDPDLRRLQQEPESLS